MSYRYQLPFVDYGDAVFTDGGGVKTDITKTEYTLGTRALKDGSKGMDVKALQEFLLQLGYALPKYGVDGDFGSETEIALKRFQVRSGRHLHKALMDAIADNDAGKEPEQPGEPDNPTAKHVCIACNSSSVNIRMGNGTQYDRITAVPNGTSLERVATAENGWHAVVVNGCVGWASGKYSELV